MDTIILGKNKDWSEWKNEIETKTESESTTPLCVWCVCECVADVILIFVGGKWLYFSRRAENNMKQFNGILSIFYATLNEKKTYQMIYFVLDNFFLSLSLNRLVSLVL